MEKWHGLKGGEKENGCGGVGATGFGTKKTVEWKTRWRMFGSTGVNGGCRSAGTEFLGTALATMETVLVSR